MKRLISLLMSVILLVGLAAAAVPVSADSEFVASDDLVEMLKILEGFDKYPRWDYKQWTVGYGTACPSEDLERYRNDGITEEEAVALLRKNLEAFGKSVNSFNDKYELNMTQNQFDAIVLFTYNMGTSWMFQEGTFRSSLINGETGNDLMFTMGKWSHAGGKVLTALVKRRMMEFNMYVNGVYSRTLPDNYCYVLYDFNGGTGETDVQCYDSDLTDAPRVTPSKDGYTFVGWYTANEGGTQVTVLDASTKNITLYARWAEVVQEPTEPEATEPEATEPEATEPEATEPEATEPEATEPEATEPEATEPEATEPETTMSIVVTLTATNVNVRKGPGTGYGIVGRVTKGDQVTITEVATGSGYTWGKYDGGWIALMYTNYDKVKDQTTEEQPPVTEPEETEPPATEPEETVPPVTEPEAAAVMGTVTGSNLRIRSGAGTSYSIQGYLQKGDRVEILETKVVGSMTWGKISKGWISMTYVKLDETTTAEPEQETDPTEPEVTEPPATTQTGTVKVGDRLRIRSGAGTGYSVTGYLYNGNKVEILETKTVSGTTWGRISKGWISLDYVTLDKTETSSGSSATTATRTLTVNADCVRIRSGAGTSNKIVGYLYRGAKVTVLESKTVNGTEWVRTDKGWVSTYYLK